MHFTGTLSGQKLVAVNASFGRAFRPILPNHLLISLMAMLSDCWKWERGSGPWLLCKCMVISLLIRFSTSLEDLNILDLNLVPVNLKLDSKGKYIRFHHSRVSGIEYRSIYLPNGTTVLQLRRLKLSAWQKAKCEAITIQIGSHSYMAGMEYRGDSMSRNGVLSHQMGPQVGSLGWAHPLDPIGCPCPSCEKHPWLQ